jgi:hypothetical protein
VLRHLVVRREAAVTEPSALVKPKDEEKEGRVERFDADDRDDDDDSRSERA